MKKKNPPSSLFHYGFSREEKYDSCTSKITHFINRCTSFFACPFCSDTDLAEEVTHTQHGQHRALECGCGAKRAKRLTQGLRGSKHLSDILMRLQSLSLEERRSFFPDEKAC